MKWSKAQLHCCVSCPLCPRLPSALLCGSAGHSRLTNKLLRLPASDWVWPRGDPSGRETVHCVSLRGLSLPAMGLTQLHPASDCHSHYSRTISTTAALPPGSRNLSFSWLNRPKGSSSPCQSVSLPLAGWPQRLQTAPSLNSLPSPAVSVPSVSCRSRPVTETIPLPRARSQRKTKKTRREAKRSKPGGKLLQLNKRLACASCREIFPFRRSINLTYGT